MTTLPRIRVSANRRFLMTDDGVPFFWLGDTAWELFHRLTREEAAHFFETRQAQRFTVIQAVALAEEISIQLFQPLMLTHRIHGRFQEIHVIHAGDFNGILKGQKNPFPGPVLRRHGQQILALISHRPRANLITLAPCQHMG